MHVEPTMDPQLLSRLSHRIGFSGRTGGESPSLVAVDHREIRPSVEKKNNGRRNFATESSGHPLAHLTRSYNSVCRKYMNRVSFIEDESFAPRDDKEQERREREEDLDPTCFAWGKQRIEILVDAYI